jgi:hypothetical protein
MNTNTGFLIILAIAGLLYLYVNFMEQINDAGVFGWQL